MTDTVIAADTSPEALLKQAVMGAEASARKAAAPPTIPGEKTGFRFDPRVAGLAGGALALGLLLGAGASSLAIPHDDRAQTAIAGIQDQLKTSRSDTERGQAQLDRIGKSLSQVQETAEVGRTEAKTRAAALVERITRSEQVLTAKIAALSEKLEQAEKEQTARIASLTASRPAPSVPAQAPIAPQAARAASPEPAETGAIADKPKSTPTENWAVREVYDGVAILEDRKRRLVEVGPGDTVPGVGRIETIERRGKAWVVVTRQGLITHQTW